MVVEMTFGSRSCDGLKNRSKPGRRLTHSPGFAVTTALVYCVLGTQPQVSVSNL
jgi:hypothetical protein